MHIAEIVFVFIENVFVFILNINLFNSIENIFHSITIHLHFNNAICDFKHRVKITVQL